MLRRFTPHILILAGLLLLAGARLFWWHTPPPASLSAEDVPEAIAGVSLSQVITGAEAIASINELHGKEFPLVDGAVAVYGNRNITLWVSAAVDEAQAIELLALMTAKIAEGRSPFIDNGVRDANGRAVYDLTGLGQRHFYWQSGSLVIWLAADESLAERALKETIRFYR